MKMLSTVALISIAIPVFGSSKEAERLEESAVVAQEPWTSPTGYLRSAVCSSNGRRVLCGPHY